MIDRVRAACAGLVLALVTSVAHGQTATPILLDQGWNDAQRSAFYSTDQGSRIMPYKWLRALEQANAPEPFLADGLARYGYLANPAGSQPLPIGFVVAGDPANGDLGMTCAACHTRQIEVDGKSIRVDGGPGDADFQKFLRELAEALSLTASDGARFTAFAKRMSNPPDRATFQRFVERFKRFMDKSLPPESWGPSRLDAFGMIFNRVAGLDLDIWDNVEPADAPVSYPFLWNAHGQDKIQWNGVAPNGTYLTALGRNLGEVLGVFADMKIKPHPLRPVTFETSARFAGLQQLEELLVRLRPPAWREDLLGAIDRDRALRGKQLFQEDCAECHQVLSGPSDPIKPIKLVAVGTDPRMADRSRREVATGAMKGTITLPALKPLAERAAAAELLGTVVGGTIAQQLLLPLSDNGRAVLHAIALDLQQPDELILKQAPRITAGLMNAKASLLEKVIAVQPPLIREQLEYGLGKLYRTAPDKPVAAYEARPLNGIWATAPYLHNGSVPSLWDLLLPPDRRTKIFPVGSRKFDAKRVGVDVTGPSGSFQLNTSGPGNGNAGHEYKRKDGRAVTDEDRWDLVEYLKTL